MNNQITSVDLALTPSNLPSFLLDWEITKRCNLDCSYCSTGIDGGHDNKTQHPPIDECLKTIDFMFEYVDLYMSHRKNLHKKVILNVYGGESLFHPDIIEILKQIKIKYHNYKDLWHLTVCCTTNGIVGENLWQQIVSLIDNFTLSYHSEALSKQKDLFFKNSLYLKKHKIPFKVVVMMHNDAKYWQDSLSAIEFCRNNAIEYIQKPLDNLNEKWAYSTEQFKSFKTFWLTQVSDRSKDNYNTLLEDVGNDQKVVSVKHGKPCCGGRKLVVNTDYKNQIYFVPTQNFENWYCSVNWFFLFIRQFTKEIFTNKDCKMNLQGKIGPIGTLDNYDEVLNDLRTQLSNKELPVIQCAKKICRCGICAPKAKQSEDFEKIISRFSTNKLFKI